MVEPGSRRRRPALLQLAIALLLLSAALPYPVAAAPKKASAPSPRGVDYFVLLDVSGSMAGSDPDRVTMLSTLLLGTLLGPDDRIMVTTYSDGGAVLIPLTSAPDFKKLSRAAGYGGGTACLAGYKALKPVMGAAHSSSPGRPQVVVVLGDGDCNSGASHADALEDLSAGRPSKVPSVFIGLGNGARASYDDVANAAASGRIISFPVHLDKSDPLAAIAASQETLLSSFAKALRVGAAYSEAVEATPTDPSLNGCMVSASTRLLVLADKPFTVTVEGLDAKGAPDSSTAVTAVETSRASYRHSSSSKEYQYAIYNVASTAAQIRIKMEPPGVNWRALFVPVHQNDVLDRSLQVGVGDCPPASLWPTDPNNPEPLTVGTRFCFRTHLTGRCDERNARVVVTEVKTGQIATTLPLARMGATGVFEAPSAPWACQRGDWSAAVIADDPVNKGQSVTLSPARTFTCASCRVAAPLDLPAKASWCCEASARVSTITVPLEEACPTKTVAVPVPKGPHAPCFSLTQSGDPRRDPSGRWIVDLDVRFDPNAMGCALDPGLARVDLPLELPGHPQTPPSKLRVSLTAPFDKLALVGDSGGAAAWDACPAAGNLDHLSIVNGSTCSVCLSGARVDLKTDGGPEQVSLVAEGSPGEELVEIAPPNLTIPPGASVPLATLRTDSTFCSLTGTHEAVLTAFPLQRYAVPVGSVRYDFDKPFLSDGWWICNAAPLTATLLLILAAAILLLFIVNTYGFPGEMHEVTITATLDDQGATQEVPTEGAYTPVPRERNWMLTRWFTGQVRYGLYVRPELNRYTGDIVFHFTDRFGFRRRVPLQSVRSVPEALQQFGAGQAVHAMRADVRAGTKVRTTRETLAELVGPFLHPLRWPLWIVIIGCIALLLYSWLHAGGLCP